MKRKDIEVGVEYAVHGNGAYELYRGIRVRVLEVGVERTGHAYDPGSVVGHSFTRKDGVHCTVLENTVGYGPKVGTSTVVPTFQVRRPWAEYALILEKHRTKNKECADRKAHQLANARKAQEILSLHGVEAKLNQHRPGLTIEFDELYNLAQALSNLKEPA